MSARYFQGTSVLGPVRASTARTFREVVDLLRICPTLPLNHADFLALPKKERNEAKQVPFFVPAAFKQSPSKRNYEEALHCNLIFLDIDEQPDGTCPAAPFFENPALLDDLLHEFNFAAHVTASSTPQKPRMRIIVEAEAIPLSEYPKAVATIGALLGLPSITRESSVAVQPMFLPTLFADSPADFQPLLTYHCERRTFTSRDLKDSLDSFHGINGSNRKHPKPHQPDPSADALEFLRAPVPEVSLAVAKEVLSKIDADLSYLEWIEVAAALRHQFSPHKEAEAFELFDEWSATGSKYAGQDETEAKWKSVRPSPNGRLPVTIRSLLRRGVEAGWNEQKVKEDVFANILAWLDLAENVTELMDKGVRRIVGAPLLTSMQEDVLVQQIAAAAKRRFSYPLTPTSVRADLKRAKQEAKTEQEATTKAKEKHLWAEGVIYVQAPDEFYRHRTGERMKAPAFNAAYGRHLMPPKKEKGGSMYEESVPEVTASQFALNNIRIPKVYDYTYEPAQPTETRFVHDGKFYLNIYSPTYPPEDKKRAAEAGRLLQNHMGNLILEAENQRHMLDWMAFQVQHPGVKVRWCPLIQSVEGAGKTFLERVMKAVLGEQNVKVINGESVKKGWNEWCFGYQIIVMDEVKVTGVNKHEVMNTLKPLITNDSITLNQRFRDVREVKNITNYMIFSNHHDALALTPGDRRYFVIKSPLQTKAQVLALGEDYFAILFNFLRDHPGAFRSFLLHWEISADFDPNGHAPRTTYMQDMVNDSANELTATVRRLLLEADFPMIQYDIVSAAALKNILQGEEGFTRVTAQQIAQVLREEGLHQIGRHMIGDERVYLWARAGISESEAVALAQERLKRGLKNLSMELLFQ